MPKVIRAPYYHLIMNVMTSGREKALRRNPSGGLP